MKKDAAIAGRERGVARYIYERAAGKTPPVIPAVNQQVNSHLGKWAGAMTTIANAAAGERLGRLMPYLNPPLEIIIAQAAWELKALRLALLGRTIEESPPEEIAVIDDDTAPEEWFYDENSFDNGMGQP